MPVGPMQPVSCTLHFGCIHASHVPIFSQGPRGSRCLLVVMGWKSGTAPRPDTAPSRVLLAPCPSAPVCVDGFWVTRVNIDGLDAAMIEAMNRIGWPRGGLVSIKGPERGRGLDK